MKLLRSFQQICQFLFRQWQLVMPSLAATEWHAYQDNISINHKRCFRHCESKRVNKLVKPQNYNHWEIQVAIFGTRVPLFLQLFGYGSITFLFFKFTNSARASRRECARLLFGSGKSFWLVKLVSSFRKYFFRAALLHISETSFHFCTNRSQE